MIDNVEQRIFGTVSDSIELNKPVGRFCPLCGRNGSTGEQTTCAYRHPPVLLNWVWGLGKESVAEYEAMYFDPAAYHEAEQLAGGQKAFSDPNRYREACEAAVHRLNFIHAVTGKRAFLKMMDVGSGDNSFVRVCQLSKHEAHGIDPSPLTECCLRGTWEDVKGKYDIITLHDVFEHILQPKACLLHLGEQLADKGILIIEMPEYLAPNEAWKRHIRPRQHPVLYSREAAEVLYAQAGYTVTAFVRPLKSSLGKMCHYLIRS